VLYPLEVLARDMLLSPSQPDKGAARIRVSQLAALRHTVKKTNMEFMRRVVPNSEAAEKPEVYYSVLKNGLKELSAVQAVDVPTGSVVRDALIAALHAPDMGPRGVQVWWDLRVEELLRNFIKFLKSFQALNL
jgi:hypothetical protein